MGLRLRLEISRRDDTDEYSVGKRFRFAVIDLDKAESYPLNFVCMLPLRVGYYGKEPNSFMKVFGDRSLTVAKQLLAESLETEEDKEVKDEIARRLKLLEPKPASGKVCVSCGKPFTIEPKKGVRQKFCPECVKRKFGSRT